MGKQVGGQVGRQAGRWKERERRGEAGRQVGRQMGREGGGEGGGRQARDTFSQDFNSQNSTSLSDEHKYKKQLFHHSPQAYAFYTKISTKGTVQYLSAKVQLILS